MEPSVNLGLVGTNRLAVLRTVTVVDRTFAQLGFAVDEFHINERHTGLVAANRDFEYADLLAQKSQRQIVEGWGRLDLLPREHLLDVGVIRLLVEPQHCTPTLRGPGHAKDNARGAFPRRVRHRQHVLDELVPFSSPKVVQRLLVVKCRTLRLLDEFVEVVLGHGLVVRWSGGTANPSHTPGFGATDILRRPDANSR